MSDDESVSSWESDEDSQASLMDEIIEEEEYIMKMISKVEKSAAKHDALQNKK